MNTPAWDAPIDNAGLSVRTVNALRAIGVKTLAEANALGRIELLRTPNISTISVAALFDTIDERKAKYPTQPAVNAVPMAQGMTLRDWFAGQVLHGLISKYGTDSRMHVYAEKSYQMADKMLAERSGQ